MGLHMNSKGLLVKKLDTAEGARELIISSSGVR